MADCHVIRGAQLVTEFPVWLEYIKALGTPFTALVAGLVGSTVAYRQWVTARNKLKLDLFDRRLAVYRAAWHFIVKLAKRDALRADDLEAFLNDAQGAQWLFDKDVVAFLVELQRDGQRALTEEHSDYSELSVTDQVERTMEWHVYVESVAQPRMRRLTELMSPYLTIKA